MSRNLLKQYSVVESDETRIIDTNSLIRRRLEAFQQAEGDDELSAQEEGGQDSGSRLMWAQEEAKQVVADAREEAEGILAEARAQAEQIAEEARNQAEAEKNLVKSDAQRQGYAEGLRKAQAEEQRLRQEYQEKGRQLENFYQQQIDELEPQLVDAITDIYQHIFHTDLLPQREILSYLISSTLRNNEGGRSFIVHVSKEDFPYVNMMKKQILAEAVSANCSVDMVEDLTLAKNECLIETENGVFDCGLGTQLAELKQKIMLLSWSREE